MSNTMRIIYDNAVARATLTASSAASASLSKSNLLTDIKSDVWRSTSTSATLTCVFGTGEVIGGVALPYCNLTSTATMRVRLYTLSGDASPAIDSGYVLCSNYAPLGYFAWGTDVLGVNAFSTGGYKYARVWVTQTLCQKVVIDIVDSANTSGYVEAGRLVLGKYWTPNINPQDVTLTPADSSTHYRNDAGDLLTDIGTRYNKLSIPLENMDPTSRNGLYRILRGNGKAGPVFVSLLPDDTDAELEQQLQVYGKFVEMSAFSAPNYRLNKNTLDIEEI